MMESIRSFIAIEIPEILRQQLGELLRDLRKAGADVKWVRPESIHLTLKFLGSVSRDLLEKIIPAVLPVVESCDSFTLTARGAGCFPSARNPRIIWIGLSWEADTVFTLHREIEAKTAELGFPPEGRPFQPHLTLGRARSPRGKIELVRWIEKNSQINLGSFRVGKVILFRSDLRPEGAVYTRLREFPMKNT